MFAVVRSLTIALLVISTMATPAGVARAQQGCEFWVAPPPTGDDTQPGTAAAPWATLEHAAETVPDAGCTVWIADGLYVGQTQLERRFTLPTTFKASSPYHATFEHSGTVLDIDGARNIIIEGLELRHTGPGATGYVVIMDRSGEIWSEDIVLRNNVLHDSYDNDLLKIHHGVRFATVEGNLFYNQGPGEQHIDVNSVTDVTVQDNVFFNDYVASDREISEDAKHFIIVKDSNASEDGLEGSQRITIRRNVFFNWQGGPEIFVKVGNDGKPIHEAVDVWIQSNLLIGNSPDVVGAAFGVAGAKNVFFTNNTVVGNLPSKAYAFRVETKGDNPPNENITFANNIWSDPTGTMGADGPGDGNAFSTGDDGSTVNLVLDTNLYWNGGAVIPAGDVASPLTDDANAVIGDPMLASDQSALVTPVWTGNGFADDSTTVREVFVELVEAYGAIPAGSPAIGGADPDAAPIDDVLGNPRSDPDLGAYEQGATSSGTFVDDDGNVHEGFIEAIAASGITRGCNPPANDRFCPSNPVTRGQMAAFVTRALELPPATRDWFVDDDGSIFEDDIDRLAEARITLGCNPPAADRYCPGDLVTRGQMAAFLVRAYGYADPGPGDWFIDDDGSIFEDDIDRLAEARITLGCNPPANDHYCPKDAVRRDQMASFLGRAGGLSPLTPS
jgi:hypothetical protein